MPKFMVRFPNPVTYLPDHPKGRRVVTELEVSAPSGPQAIIHAIRVVAGEVGEPTAVPYAPVPVAPAVEVQC